MDKLVIFLLDAARPDYVSRDNMPYLYSLKSANGSKVLRPSFGYCERSEIMAGTSATESGFFTAIGYAPLLSDYRRVKLLLSLIMALDAITLGVFSGFIRKLVRRLFGFLGFKMSPYNIPYRFLPHFSLTEDSEEGVEFVKKSKNSLLAFCEKKGLSVNLETFTSLGSYDFANDISRLKYLKRLLVKQKYLVHFVYIAHCDFYGHHMGPDSDEFRLSLQDLDNTLKEFDTWCNKKLNNIKLVFIGDHGMRSVDTRVDIISMIRSFIRQSPNTLKCYFVDSTICRFWFVDGQSPDAFMDWLIVSKELTTHGNFVRRSEYPRFGIPCDRRYGDIMWIANPGTILEPNFFNDTNVRLNGMHGYPFTGPEDCGFITTNFMPLSNENLELREVNIILRQALESFAH